MMITVLAILTEIFLLASRAPAWTYAFVFAVYAIVKIAFNLNVIVKKKSAE